MKSKDRLVAEKTETKEAEKKVIRETLKDAGMPLSDDELDHVSGGGDFGSCWEPPR